MPTNLTPVTLIGFGEVGQILATDLAALGSVTIAAYDTAFARPDSPQLAAARRSGVRIAASHADAVRGAQLVISAVTAGSASDAARTIAGHVDRETFVVDFNSVAPGTKCAIAQTFANGRYVEAAVMAAIAPKRLKTPILLGGPHADAAELFLHALGFAATSYSPEYGRASSVKMCRSVLVKGLEALMMECMLASRHYGVTDEVLASLTDTFRNHDIPKLAGYLVSRSLLHGRRRSEEMLEVAATVEAAGVTPRMSRATAEVQAWAAEQGAKLDPALFERHQIAELLDALSAGDGDLPQGKAVT